jgi:aminotransferase
VCIASLPGGRDCTLLLDGFSKNYAMTGWRVGYAAGPKEVLAAMTKIHQYTMLCAPTPSQHAAIEALREGGDAAERMREEYKRRRNYIMDALSSMGMDFVKPEGAFYIFPKVEKFGLEAAQFCRHLLLEEKVAVVPGAVFGESGKAHIRISYASSFEQIEEAMERMCRFLERLKVYEVSSLYRPTDSRGNKG